MTAQRFEFPATAIFRPDGNSGPEVTTALICDNPLLRRGLQQMLSGTPFVIVEVGPVTDSRLGSEVRREPSLVILAVGQPSSRTPEMIRQSKELHPVARTVVLADRLDLDLMTKAREAGGDGFCLTDSSPDVLVTSLELIMLGENLLPGAMVRSILNGMALNPEPESPGKVPHEPKVFDPRARRLSAREADILSSLMEGTPNKLIARKLHVTEATVKVHVKAILRKIGATNRTQAAMWAKGHQHG